MADDKIDFPARQGDCRLFPVRIVNSRSVCGRYPSGSFVQSTMFPQCSPLCGRCRQELLTHFHLLLRKKSRYAAASSPSSDKAGNILPNPHVSNGKLCRLCARRRAADRLLCSGVSGKYPRRLRFRSCPRRRRGIRYTERTRDCRSASGEFGRPYADVE